MNAASCLACLITLSTMLTACVSAPPARPVPPPVVVAPPTSQPGPGVTPPASVTTPDEITPQPLPPAGITLPAPTQPVETARVSEAQARTLLNRLLPATIRDRAGWREDILDAFTALKIPYEAPYFCAALSVIEQESSWQADPGVPNLDQIVWKEIEQRAHKYHVPLMAVKVALLKPSPDGRSYKARIDALKTEKEMNAIFEDMVADAGRLGLPLSMKNPIRTGGPMQVSVDFAESHVRAWPYPYRRKGSVRQEVFTRRGGLYFGIAILLQYRVNYPDMSYRFADFNAGRYSSRNAAFQAALAKLGKKALVLDGDLLRYGSREASTTQELLLKLTGRLGLSASAIQRDLQLEKAEAFAQTPLYRRVFELASQQAGRALPQAVMPQIRLVSPKITRKLTTEWFAKRVDGRYRTCLGRQTAL